MENLVVSILQIERQFWVTKAGEMLAIFPQCFAMNLLESKKVWVAIFDWETLENCLAFRLYRLSINCGLLMKREMLGVLVVHFFWMTLL